MLGPAPVIRGSVDYLGANGEEIPESYDNPLAKAAPFDTHRSESYPERLLVRSVLFDDGDATQRGR